MEKPTIIRYAAGTLCIVLGFFPVILGYQSWGETGILGWSLYAAMILLFGWSGIQPLLNFSRASLNRCIAIIVIFGTFFLFNALLGAISTPDHFDEVNTSFSLFFVTVIAIFLQVVIMKFLTRWSDMDSPRVNELIGRGVLIFLALQVWHMLSVIVGLYWVEEGQYGRPRTGGLIVPIFLAIGFYQWAKRLVGIRKVETKPFSINLEDSK